MTFCQLPSVNHLARFIVFSAVCSLFDHHLPSLPLLPHLFSRLCLPYCTESACGFLPGPANVTPYNLPYLHLDSSLAHPSDTTLGELVPLNLLPFSCHHRTFALCPFTCPNSCQHNTRHEGTQSQPPRGLGTDTRPSFSSSSAPRSISLPSICPSFCAGVLSSALCTYPHNSFSPSPLPSQSALFFERPQLQDQTLVLLSLPTDSESHANPIFPDTLSATSNACCLPGRVLFPHAWHS